MNYHIIKSDIQNRLLKDSEFKLIEVEAVRPLDILNKKVCYNLFFITDFTEKMAGISEEDISLYKIHWEYLGVDYQPFNKNYYVFRGIENISNEGCKKFVNVVIGIEKGQLIELMEGFIIKNPNTLSNKKLNSINGFQFVNIKINESNKIFGEKIKTIYHYKSFGWEVLAMIIEFESGIRCFMNGYNVDIWEKENHLDAVLIPINFFYEDKYIKSFYEGKRVIDIFEHEDGGWKFLKLENEFEIGVKNDSFNKIFVVGSDFFWNPKD
ncbi:MAG: hypothetical protein ACYCZ2_15035 [Lutibacter sp.]